ncbi:MAG: sugar-binding domain-containing protein [Pseudomonadota bacterium]
MDDAGDPRDDDQAPRLPPAGVAGDAMLWAAWLYYGEALTQNEVAAALGVSRTSVANYLAEARRRGLVTIDLDPDLLAQLDLGRRLAARHGLAGVHVAPAIEGEGEESAAALRGRLGRAAAHVVGAWLSDGNVIGVAWGRTMLEMAHALPRRELGRVEVVQLSGSSLGDAVTSPEACTVLIAGRLGARSRNFHAPAVVSSRDLCDALLAEPALERHFARLRACDIAVLGIGELGPGTTWSDTDFLPSSVVDAYLAAGSAGVVLGRFIDAEGREVQGPLTGRQIGMALDALAALPVRIGVAGGAAKVAAIRATLKGGYLTHLVTDRTTAETLMKEAP